MIFDTAMMPAKHKKESKDIIMAKKKSKEEKKGRMTKKEIIQAILILFQSTPKSVYNYRQISKQIGVDNQIQKHLVADILYDLANDGFIREQIGRAHV